MLNAAHLHLILVHGISALAWVSLLLLIFCYLFRAERGLRLVTMITALVMAAGMVLAMNSGHAAAGLVKSLPGVDPAAIHEHEEMGELLYPLALVAGFFTAVWYSLVQQRAERVRGWAWWVGTALILATTLFATYTSTLGGAIHHPEAQKGWQAPAVPGNHEHPDRTPDHPELPSKQESPTVDSD